MYRMTPAGKALAWALLAILAGLLTYVSFRAYLSPALLLDFANQVTC